MGPLARIIVRYGAGALANMGFFAPELAERMAADADVIQMVSYGLAGGALVLTEGYYWLAKRRNWKT